MWVEVSYEEFKTLGYAGALVCTGVFEDCDIPFWYLRKEWGIWHSSSDSLSELEQFPRKGEMFFVWVGDDADSLGVS